MSRTGSGLALRLGGATVRAFAIVVALLALSACSLFVPKLEPPRLSVVEVEFLKGALWQQKLRVRMHVTNPNDRVLPVRGITYQLEVNGQEFAHGESAASFTVPALGEAEFDMNMTANMAGTLISLLSHGVDANVDYHLTGRISLSEGLLRSIPFDQHGTFKLQ
ncbi:MAG TPA: LEA type 2 family protein [Steroidobacteraceae bacterium]|nr:LEA type 2 family protein [Steroidobacteraceae bacterium]